MKSVLISIQPRRCELIAAGKKTIEVRKTKPKIDAPFGCYIYETQGATDMPWMDEDGHMIFKGRGQVIGEFVCDLILPLTVYYSDPNSCVALQKFPSTCLTDKEIIDYLGNGKQGYAWHISDFKNYYKPKELSEFYHYLPDSILDSGDYDCRGAGEVICMDAPEGSEACAECPYGGRVYLKRPPQSWCYVEKC